MRALAEGLPFDNVYHHTHHYGNNSPMISFMHKIDLANKEEQFIEGLKCCEN